MWRGERDEPVPEMKMGSGKQRLYAAGPAIIILSVTIIAWEMIVRVFNIKPMFLPPPSLVAENAARFGLMLVPHISVTLYVTVAGFIVGALLAVAMAVVITYSTLLRNTLLPILLVVQSVPKQAFAPLVLVWFGYGDVPKIIIALLVGFFPIVIDTTAGLNAVEPELLDLARTMQASKMKILLKVRLPNSIPYFFNGLKIAAALSVVGALVAEFLTGTYGLGYMMLQAQFAMNMALIITIIFILGLIGIGLFGAASLAERLAMPWKRRMGGGGG